MKVSIVTPTYNSQRYIAETILTIKNQTYQHFEHIIIDGKSTDNTVNIIKEHNHITLISEKDKGQSDAINKGLRIATGDILAWQNADDLYMEDTLKTVVDHFTVHPEVDIVYGNYQLIDSESQWICNVYPMRWSTWMFAHGRFCPLQPTVFWRREVTERVGLLNENLHYCMDVDFFSRVVKAGFTFSRIPQMLGKFRVHDESKTQNQENELKVYLEYKEVLASNFTYNFTDYILFDFFQWRSKLARGVKLKFLKRL